MMKNWGKQVLGTPWAAAWINPIETSGDPLRIERGWRYWQRGMVSIIQIEPGQILAAVEGSGSVPYSAVIEMPVPNATDWVLDGADARRFLCLSADIKSNSVLAFLAEELEALFPTWDEVASYCTCPDWTFPCKHVAAVWYAVAELIAIDPQTLLTLRGLTTSGDEAMAVTPATAVDPDDSNDSAGSHEALEPARPVDRPAESAESAEAAEWPATEPRLTPEPVTVDVTSFWRGKPEAPIAEGSVNGGCGIPAWVLQPPQDFKRRVRANKPTYAEVMLRAYDAIQQGAARFLSFDPAEKPVEAD